MSKELSGILGGAPQGALRSPRESSGIPRGIRAILGLLGIPLGFPSALTRWGSLGLLKGPDALPKVPGGLFRFRRIPEGLAMGSQGP